MPVKYRIAGLICLVVGFISSTLIFLSPKFEEHLENFLASIFFIIIGFIALTFRNHIFFDKNKRQIVRKEKIFWIPISNKKIIVPQEYNKVVIKLLTKTADSYVNLVQSVPVSYTSADMFFVTPTKVRRIINTDFKRALKIAEMIKQVFEIEYEVN